LARPGMVLDSCRNVFMPVSFPIKTGGALVNPPIARTASDGAGGKFSARRTGISQSCRRRRNNSGLQSDGGKVKISNGAPSTVSACWWTLSISRRDGARRSSADFTACWSISFGEMSNATAQPRCCNCAATASPGKRWPPVPPQAMATKAFWFPGRSCCPRGKRVVAGFDDRLGSSFRGRNFPARERAARRSTKFRRRLASRADLSRRN